jgi:hypothetical protein
MRLFSVSLAFLALSAGPVSAAPFCVATQYGENCWYYNRSSCEEAAARSRGACIINQEEIQRRDSPSVFGSPAPHQSSPYRSPSSGPPFCVVTQYTTNCYYYDAPSCQRAAAEKNGMCVYNPD